jgi:DNA-binding winged helix-turn-helix (wHTH) protein
MTCSCAEEIQYLREELGLVVRETTVADLMTRYGLTRLQGRSLAVLWQAKGRLVTVSYMLACTPRLDEESLDPDNLVKQIVSHIRRKMGRDTIATIRGLGYRLTTEGQQRVLAALDENQRSPHLHAAQYGNRHEAQAACEVCETIGAAPV